MIDNPYLNKQSSRSGIVSAWHRFSASGGMDASAGLEVAATLAVVVGSALLLVFGMAGDRSGIVSIAIVATTSVIALFIHRSTSRVGPALDLMLAGMFVAICSITYFAGGLTAWPPYWLLAMPMLASALGFRRRAMFWMIASCVFAFALYLMERGGHAFPASELTPVAKHTEDMFLLIFFLVAAFVAYSLNDTSRRRAILELKSANEELSVAQEVAHALREKLEQRVDDKTQELKDSEEQLRHSQKMEAVGQLATGIAHDFNNLLAVIIGYSGMRLMSLKPEDPLHHELNEIKEAGDRAAALTGQLLAFSRKQILRPKVINLAEIVTGMQNMLRRLIGEHIQFNFQYDPKPQIVKADPGQIEQVIMNLVVNARDAMPQGGNITVNIENVVLDDQTVAALGDLPVGSYVMLTVSDTGIGMDKETLSHIFEPFYTTRGPEKGTGLGLSTVFGIVKQSGGGIEVESEPTMGSTFRVYLRQVEESEHVAQEKAHPVSPVEGHETILVVEDEDMVRELLTSGLKEFGYLVFPARHGREALLIAEGHVGQIDLMITDIVMPEMSGYELANRLATLQPEMSVLYISGYNDAMVANQGVAALDIQYLPKPFEIKALAMKTREILDEHVSSH